MKDKVKLPIGIGNQSDVLEQTDSPPNPKPPHSMILSSPWRLAFSMKVAPSNSHSTHSEFLPHFFLPVFWELCLFVLINFFETRPYCVTQPAWYSRPSRLSLLKARISGKCIHIQPSSKSYLFWEREGRRGGWAEWKIKRKRENKSGEKIFF